MEINQLLYDGYLDIPLPCNTSQQLFFQTEIMLTVFLVFISVKLQYVSQAGVLFKVRAIRFEALDVVEDVNYHIEEVLCLLGEWQANHEGRLILFSL